MSDAAQPYLRALGALLRFVLTVGIALAVMFGIVSPIVNHVYTQDRFRRTLLDCNARGGRLVASGSRHNSGWGPDNVPAYRCVTP